MPHERCIRCAKFNILSYTHAHYSNNFIKIIFIVFDLSALSIMMQSSKMSLNTNKTKNPVLNVTVWFISRAIFSKKPIRVRLMIPAIFMMLSQNNKIQQKFNTITSYN